MAKYCYNCPSFDSFARGDKYPWRSFCYNHTPDFICVFIQANELEERFKLYLVQDGIYVDSLSYTDSDEMIDTWIQKVNVIVENQYGKHLNVHSASDIRKYVKDYVAYMGAYDYTREPDMKLERQAHNLSVLASYFPIGSKEREQYELESKAYLEKQQQNEEALFPLFDAIDKIFEDRWYKDIPSDDIYDFGWIAEQYHAALYGRTKDMIENIDVVTASLVLSFYKLIVSADENLFEKYLRWNQPDQKTIDVIREMLVIIGKVFAIQDQ